MPKDDSSYKPPNKRNTNTDNKRHLFVTFFAICSCYQDSFVMWDKPESLHCFQ